VFGFLTGGQSISTDEYTDVRKVARDHEGLVACFFPGSTDVFSVGQDPSRLFPLSFVTSSDQSGLIFVFRKEREEVHNKRSFFRSSEGQISHADDRKRCPAYFPQFVVEQEVVDPASHLVDKNEGTQHPIHSLRTIQHLPVCFKIQRMEGTMSDRSWMAFSSGCLTLVPLGIQIFRLRCYLQLDYYFDLGLANVIFYKISKWDIVRTAIAKN